MDDSEVQRLLVRYPHLRAAAINRVYKSLVSEAYRGGHNLSPKQAQSLIEDAAASSAVNGYDFEDIVRVIAANLTPTTSNGQPKPRPSVKPVLGSKARAGRKPSASIGIACRSPGLSKRVCRVLIAFDSHAVSLKVGTPDDIFDLLLRRKPDLLILEAKEPHQEALSELRMFLSKFDKPVLVIGPGELGSALDLLHTGAQEYVEQDRIESWLRDRVVLYLPAEKPSERPPSKPSSPPKVTPSPQPTKAAPLLPACDGKDSDRPKQSAETVDHAQRLWNRAASVVCRIVFDPLLFVAESPWRLCKWLVVDCSETAILFAAASLLLLWAALTVSHLSFGASVAATQEVAASVSGTTPHSIPTVRELFAAIILVSGCAAPIYAAAQLLMRRSR